MTSDLSTLFAAMKSGSPEGVSIADSLPGKRDSDYIIEIYNRAINEGFAVKGETPAFGIDMAVKLAAEAKNFDTYEDFTARNKVNATSITTNNMTINAPISAAVVGNDFSLDNTQLTDILKQYPTQKANAKLFQNTKSIRRIIDNIAKIAGLLAILIEIMQKLV